MCEILAYVDFWNIATKEPKWYMGFSDNTNFTFLSPVLADTAAIYGPCFPSFGFTPWHESVRDAFDILTGKTAVSHGYDLWERDDGSPEDPLAPYNLTEKTEYRYLNMTTLDKNFMFDTTKASRICPFRWTLENTK